VISEIRAIDAETRPSFRLRAEANPFPQPFANGFAECWAGSCHRDLLDHVIKLNQRDLKLPISVPIDTHPFRYFPL